MTDYFPHLLFTSYFFPFTSYFNSWARKGFDGDFEV